MSIQSFYMPTSWHSRERGLLRTTPSLTFHDSSLSAIPLLHTTHPLYLNSGESLLRTPRLQTNTIYHLQLYRKLIPTQISISTPPFYNTKQPLLPFCSIIQRSITTLGHLNPTQMISRYMMLC